VKTYKNLFDRVTAFDNLLLAARKAQKGKRFKKACAVFNLNLEKELLRLQRKLKEQTYRHGSYRDFFVYDPKQRLISAAPYRDRVVHHALCNVIEPLFDRSFINDTYACRKGKGTHATVNRYSQYARKYCYVLKYDIQKYFQSMDHDILLGIVARKIRCAHTLWLIREIVGSRNDTNWPFYFKGDDLFTPLQRKRGIPLGNLTSQFFGNVYLDGFDHFVKETLRLPYIRYVDDFVAFCNKKERLRQAKQAMTGFLASLRLKIHPKKCRIHRVKEGVRFLGYRIFPTHRLLIKDNAFRMRRRLKKMSALYLEGDISLARVHQSVQSWIGHASHADTYRLRSRILGSVVFQRGKARGPAGRFVEQQPEQRPLCEPQQEQPGEQEQQQRVPLRQDFDILHGAGALSFREDRGVHH
jgi:retron-type reverse transcriptase